MDDNSPKAEIRANDTSKVANSTNLPKLANLAIFSQRRRFEPTSFPGSLAPSDVKRRDPGNGVGFEGMCSLEGYQRSGKFDE